MRLLLVVGGMLALAVSALTPAIASHFTPLQVQWHRFPPFTGDLFRAFCNSKCETELWSTAKLRDHTSFIHSKPLREACVATCVTAKKAAQH